MLIGLSNIGEQRLPVCKIFAVFYFWVLNKANASDTEAAFLDLHLSISNDIVSTKIYDKHF